jgi:hypothetical protein
VVLGGEQLDGLRDQRGLVEAGHAAERGHDAGVEAASADGGVPQVDDRVPAGVQARQRGADGDGLARADLPGDHTQRSFGDAPADAGVGFGVRAVAVQLARSQRAAERSAGETVVGLQLVDHSVTSPLLS